MAIDRRVARSRKALYRALVVLIRAKPYDAITVDDILNEADVGRSTFYAHFTSKDDLLERSLERLKTMLVAARDGQLDGAEWPIDKTWDPCRALFEHLAQFSDIQVALADGRGGLIVSGAIDAVLSSILNNSLAKDNGEALPRDLIVAHFVSTFNGVLRWWLRSHPDLSVAEVDSHFRRLLLSGAGCRAYEPFLVDSRRSASGPPTVIP